MTAIPGIPEVRAWADVPASLVSDDQIELIIAAERQIQEAYCDWIVTFDDDGTTLPDALAQALLRRCARAIAARGLPLGSLPPSSTGTGYEYGVMSVLPRLDAEVERYEAPFRVTAIA